MTILDVGVKQPEDEPTYLGDGLYAHFDGFHVELFASNGMIKTNQVFLEPAVLESFLNYLKSRVPQ